MRALFALCLGVHALGVHARPATAETPVLETPEPELVDMTPADPAEWSMRYVVAPIGALFRGRSYFYGERIVEIDTTPSGGYVDLFYVRSGFQKRFEQAESPVRVVLPSRLDAGPRDSLTVRAFAEGHRQQTVTVKVRASERVITIDLAPLPNTLEGISHRYFAGRSSIGFLTKEALAFRIQKADDGFSVILTETAMSKAAGQGVEALRSSLVAEAYGQQLGEDLMVRLVLTPEALADSDVRSRQSYDAPRSLYRFVVDITPKDAGAEAVRTAQAALAALTEADVSGCRLAFDDALRGGIDAGSLARALTPQGSFVDPYVRAAMRRLGELSVDGVVDFDDGSRFRPERPIELEMSLSQAAHARGFLALLDAFVDGLESGEYREEALRGLIAPEVADDRFRALLDESRQAEARCRKGAA